MRTGRTRRHVTLLCTAALVTGCGGHARRSVPPQPKLPAALAGQLASSSDAVAAKLDANDGCGALAEARRLQQRTIAAINAHRVPAVFQEDLLSATNQLVHGITCTPAPPPPEEHHGKGKGHGKHGEGD